MATSTKEAVWATSGDAGWRAWCDAIYDCMIEAGWTLVADSGDRAVPAADTYPLANTFSYWIFRLNDTAQTNAPVYVKFEVGRGTATSTARWQITMGTGSDGAGTITGQVMPQVSHGTTGWTPSTTDPIIFRACVNADMGVAWFAAGGEIGGGAIGIFRTLDDDGTPNAKGWYGWFQLNSSTNYDYFLDVENNVVTNESGLFEAPFASLSITRLQSGGVAPVFPGRQWCDTRSYYLGGYYGCSNSDFPHGTVTEVSHFATPRTYIKIGGNGIAPHSLDRAGYTHYGVLLAWE